MGNCALRLRRVGARAILTFKQRLPTKSSIKHQREHETEVADAEAAHAILTALGFRPALVYEKRRTRFDLGRAEIVIDELPFGLFMEVEGTEKEIARVEALLGIEDLPAVVDPEVFRGISEVAFSRRFTRLLPQAVPYPSMARSSVVAIVDVNPVNGIHDAHGSRPSIEFRGNKRRVLSQGLLEILEHATIPRRPHHVRK